MKFDAIITAYGDIITLQKAIASEAREMARSRVAFSKEKEKLVIHVEADDATALRASMNTILKLLVVHEKMSKIE